MFIEEITIEGFKSYATRVNIPGFDRYFNAITGLNGTGKSNILDSICFVLGITNLSQVGPVTSFLGPRSAVLFVGYLLERCPGKQQACSTDLCACLQVRANSLQELVYKQGQAGVTKASVSIVFNNSDKANSPVSYEACDKITVTRQLVIGGRSKYLINGHQAQPGYAAWLSRLLFAAGHSQQAADGGFWYPQACAEPVPQRAAQRQQPPLPHHAGAHHQGEHPLACIPA